MTSEREVDRIERVLDNPEAKHGNALGMIRGRHGREFLRHIIRETLTHSRAQRDDVSAAREVQASRVMPLIGPLLDAWDGLGNDQRNYTNGFQRYMALLAAALREVERETLEREAFDNAAAVSILRVACQHIDGLDISKQSSCPEDMAMWAVTYIERLLAEAGKGSP